LHRKNDDLFNKILQDFKAGSCIPDIAKKYFVPQTLVWSVVLQGKTDQERFKDLNFLSHSFEGDSKISSTILSKAALEWCFVNSCASKYR